LNVAVLLRGGQYRFVAEPVADHREILKELLSPGRVCIEVQPDNLGSAKRRSADLVVLTTRV